MPSPLGNTPTSGEPPRLVLCLNKLSFFEFVPRVGFDALAVNDFCFPRGYIAILLIFFRENKDCTYAAPSFTPIPASTSNTVFADRH